MEMPGSSSAGLAQAASGAAGAHTKEPSRAQRSHYQMLAGSIAPWRVSLDQDAVDPVFQPGRAKTLDIDELKAHAARPKPAPHPAHDGAGVYRLFARIRRDEKVEIDQRSFRQGSPGFEENAAQREITGYAVQVLPRRPFHLDPGIQDSNPRRDPAEFSSISAHDGFCMGEPEKRAPDLPARG